MSNNLIELILSIIGSVSSVASLLVSIRTTEVKEAIPSDALSKPKKWPFVVISLTTTISFILSLVWFINPKVNFGWGVVGVFCISLISLIVYAYKASKSFDNYYILPPERLWQVLFNKIPSHIKNTNQLIFKFLVLKMEDSEEVNEAGRRIEASYQGREDFQVDVRSIHDESATVLLDDYCGVIFIVGENCFTRQKEVLERMDEYSKQLVLPIAYIRVGNNHYRLRKYHRISTTYLDKNCANHLIMRSYRRSEHWIQLSQLSHIALWGVIAFAVLSFMAFAISEKNVVKKDKIIQEETDRVNCLTDSINSLSEDLIRLGGNRSVIHLSNAYVGTFLPDSIDIEALRQDGAFKTFVDGFAMYFFDEVNPKNVLLWLRKDKYSDLVCIYDNNNDDPTRNLPKGSNSMIGGIANHKGTFVLWPGCINNDTVWKDSTQNSMAWFNDDNGVFAFSELKNDGSRNTSLILKRTKESTTYDTLYWYVNDKKNQKEDDMALYGFSFDGRLAIELDFDYQDVNNNDKRIYIQNLMFRNTLRKFSACVTSYINSRNLLNQEKK